jgi:hypothetical protein
VPAATAQHRVNDSAALPGLRMANKQEILFANGGRPDGVFAEVVVNLQAAILDVTVTDLIPIVFRPKLGS